MTPLSNQSIPALIGQPRSHAYVDNDIHGFDCVGHLWELDEIELPAEGGPDEARTAEGGDYML